MPHFRRSDGVEVIVLDQYEDTIVRLRSEGWQEFTPDAPEPLAEESQAPASDATESAEHQASGPRKPGRPRRG